MNDLPGLDPGSHIDRRTGFVQRRSLFPIADQEPELGGAFAEVHELVAGPLGGPGVGGVGGDAQDVHAGVWISIANKT